MIAMANLGIRMLSKGVSAKDAKKIFETEKTKPYPVYFEKTLIPLIENLKK